MISEPKGYYPSPNMTNEFGTPIATPKAIKGVRNIKQFLDVKIDLGLDLKVSWISEVWDPHCDPEGNQAAPKYTSPGC